MKICIPCQQELSEKRRRRKAANEKAQAEANSTGQPHAIIKVNGIYKIVKFEHAGAGNYLKVFQVNT